MRISWRSVRTCSIQIGLGFDAVHARYRYLQLSHAGTAGKSLASNGATCRSRRRHLHFGDYIFGAARSKARAKYDGLIDALSDRLDFIADWSTNEADRFADVQARLLGQGTPIGANDTMITAHTLSLGAVLVTNNQRHFSKVEGLALENWLDQPN